MRHTLGSATFAMTHLTTDFMAEIMPRKYKNVVLACHEKKPLTGSARGFNATAGLATSDGHPHLCGVAAGGRFRVAHADRLPETTNPPCHGGFAGVERRGGCLGSRHMSQVI